MPDDDKPAPKAKPKADGPAYRVLKALQWGTHRAAPGTIRRDIPVQSVAWLIADGSIRPLTDDEVQAMTRDVPADEDTPSPEAEADHAGD